MYRWGTRRGSGSRAPQSNFDVGDGRTDPRDRRSHATSEVTEIIYVPQPRPIIELVIIVTFAVGLAVTATIVLLALAFQFGTHNPYDINVDHVAKYCYDDRDYGDMAAQAQRMLPIDRSSGSSSSSEDREYRGTGSAITIYVPCPSGGDDDEGYGGYDSGGGDSGGYYLRRRPGEGGSQ